MLTIMRPTLKTRASALKETQRNGRAEELQKRNAELLNLLEQKSGKSESSSKQGEFPRIRMNG
ncbi:MAG: hypothetical protein IT342_09830 [Candidatus Melainabacteria bacterium]|nr:hypothetical protein [Candidatus Melainabacteria bacterium]